MPLFLQEPPYDVASLTTSPLLFIYPVYLPSLLLTIFPYLLALQAPSLLLTILPYLLALQAPSLFAHPILLLRFFVPSVDYLDATPHSPGIPSDVPS